MYHHLPCLIGHKLLKERYTSPQQPVVYLGMCKKASVHPFHRGFPASTRANMSLSNLIPSPISPLVNSLNQSLLFSFLLTIFLPLPGFVVLNTALNPCVLGYAYLTVPVCSSSLDLQRFRYRRLYLWNTNQHHLPHYHPLAPGNGNEDMGKDPTGQIA